MGSVTGLGVSAGILLCTPLAVALKGCVAPRTYSAVYGCEIKHFGRAIKQEHSFYHLLEVWLVSLVHVIRHCFASV